MGEPVRIELLGGLRVTRGGQPLAGFLSRKSPALLAYLALTGVPQPRERLASLLWGEFPEAFARNSLRQVLANLNKLVGEHLIITRATVGLNPDHPPMIDVAAFEAYLSVDAPDTTALAAAAALYAGDFLDGFVVPDALAFEEWALAQRARLREVALDTFGRLASAQLRDDPRAAAATLRHQLALEPWHEEAHRQLMRALVASGQRDAALAQYAICRRALATELGVEPAAETTALYEQILQHRLVPESREVRVPAESPPPAAVPTARPRHNLPAPATSFIGRDAALAALRSLLTPGEVANRPRLITLTGVGGSGKSSLAIRAAAEQVAAYADGVWLVELADLADQALIVQSLAGVLDVKAVQGQILQQAILDPLRDRQLLLVLDNCEHLLEGCGQMAAALLRDCPGVTILATSRQPLGLADEVRWPVPTLAVDEGATGEEGAPAPAVALFVARARAVRPDFQPGADELRTVAEICRQLDGLPLAIELAAARCIAMSPGEIAARLDDRFRLLVSADASVAPHQRTLVATLDWSHDLLVNDERILLRRLAIFAGGWTLEAAEAICADGSDGDLRPWDILDLLVRLITKSLVQVESQPQSGTRYRMLETVRQYAAQRLVVSADAAPLRARHAAHYLALAETTAPHLTGPDQAARLARLDRELDNLRAALAWARETGAVAIELRLAGAVARFWHDRGYLAEGRAWLEEALARSRSAEVSATVTARALYVTGMLANAQGDQVAAIGWLEESIALYRAAGDHVGAARALNTLGGAAFDQGDMASAVRDFSACLELLRVENDPGEVARALGNLGEANYHLGDLDRASACYEEALALAGAAGRRDVEAYVLGDVGNVARLRGDLRGAAEYHRRALDLKWALGSRRQVAISLEDLAALAASLGQGAQAARLLGAATALRETIGSPQPVPERRATERAVAAVRAQVGDASWAAAFAAGGALPLERVVDDALDWALAAEAMLASEAACPQGLVAEPEGEPVAEPPAPRERVPQHEPRPAPDSPTGERRALPEPPAIPDPSTRGDGVPLPLPPTAILGREREVGTLAALLADPGVRLVTLVGPPGVGKTRLATEAATGAARRLANGVVFVNLASLTDPALVPATIAQALGLREIGSRPPLDVLKLHLGPREVLLLLDNFEHVLVAGVVVGELLAACPGVRALVTSREALHLRGEHEFPVAPLDLPDLARVQSPYALMAHGAITLFVARAQAVQPAFALTADNAPAVAEICARLDGLPLAIELAAARVKLFPPEALLARLAGRAPGTALALLTGGARDLAPRQRTLRAALEWSYALLDEDEQRLFRWFALFPGGCTLELAEAVAGEEAAGRPVFDLVASLLDKSLLGRDLHSATGAEPRFGMLEMVREYAGEQLAATGEAELARQRQLACYLDLARDAEIGLRSAGQVAWLGRLEDEHGNLLATLAGCLAVGEVAGALRLAGALGEFWCRCGYGGIGLDWLTRLLAHGAMPRLARDERAKALLVAGRLAYLQSDPPAACGWLDESEALFRAEGDAGRRGLAEALTWLGTSIMSRDADIARASAAIGEGVDLARTVGDRWVLAVALTRLAMVQLTAGDAARAEPLLAEALALWRAVGDRWGLGWAHFYLGQAAELTGDVLLARSRYDESLAAWRAVREPWGIIMALGYLGNLTKLAGENALARAHYAECLAILQRTGQRAFSAYIYNRLGGLAALAGELDEAQRLYHEGLTILQETNYRRGIAEWLVSLADVAHARDRLSLAARLIGASSALLDAAGLTLFAGDRADVARLEAALRAALGDGQFVVAYEEGRAPPEEWAIAEAFGALG